MLFPGHVSSDGRHAGAYDPRTGKTRKVMFVIVLMLVVFLIAWPFIEPYLLEVETVTLRSADLPASIGQLRVVYLTDIHLGSGMTDQRVSDLIGRINELNADLVLLGGDYALDSEGAIRFFRSMPRIHARYGVYAVPGNHDRTIPESNLTELRAAMQRVGVTPLVNAVVPVRIGSGTVYLAGIDDVNNGHPTLQSVASQVRSQDFVIFLSHSPAVIPEALAAEDRSRNLRWFDLGLFGHTHGGQIGLFGGIVRDDSVDARYRSGWVNQNRTALLTSRGVGTSILPVRLFCRPQIHLITIISDQ